MTNLIDRTIFRLKKKLQPMNLFKTAYYYFVLFDLDKAIKKAERDLSKLRERIMQGDAKAASLAWVQLEEYDNLKIEFERRNYLPAIVEFITVIDLTLKELKK